MGCCLQGFIGGIDEAGRGPLAGPVVSSCVIWKEIPAADVPIKDSKLLSEKSRLAAYPWIMEKAHRVGIGLATSEEIDRLNILRASILSMERALEDTGIAPDLLLIDGIHGIPGFPAGKAVVRGDRKCFFVASASIIAKVVRDRIMEAYHVTYPRYRFDIHKGYPTRQHRQVIAEAGVSPIHRKTFRGVREYCAQQESPRRRG